MDLLVRHRPTGWMGLAVAALLATACGDGCSGGPDLGGSDTGPGDAAPADVDYSSLVAFDQFADDLLEAACQKALECCSAEERAEAGIEAEAPEECGGSGSIGVDIALQPHRDGIREGGVKFDRGLARLCLDSVRTADCSQFDPHRSVFENRSLRGCSETLEPTLAPDEACETHASCQTEFCRHEETGSDVCAAPPEAGESCEQLVCATGHYCDTASRTPTCRVLGETGDECRSDRECRSRLCRDGTCAAADPVCDGA